MCTCLGTSRLLCCFMSAPVGVRDRVKVVRNRCMLRGIWGWSECECECECKRDEAGVVEGAMVAVVIRCSSNTNKHIHTRAHARAHENDEWGELGDPRVCTFLNEHVCVCVLSACVRV